MKSVIASLPKSDVLLEQDIEWLASIGDCCQYPISHCLIVEGETADSVYFCLNGQCAALMLSAGQTDTLMTLNAGNLLGETGVLDQRPSSITIQTLEPSEVLMIPRAKLLEKLKVDQAFAGRFYHLVAVQLSRQLRELSNLMAKRQIKEGEPLRKVLMVFATLNDADVSWMIANGKSERTSLGHALIQQGESVPAVYLLLDGTLGVYIAMGGRDVEVAKRVKGDILGEMSFVDGGTASATVKTLENAWVLALPQPMLAAKMQEDPGFASRFYLAIAQILSTRCQDLLVRGGLAEMDAEPVNLLSEDISVEDEIDFDVLEGTAIAGTRFDWLIQQLRR